MRRRLLPEQLRGSVNAPAALLHCIRNVSPLRLVPTCAPCSADQRQVGLPDDLALRDVLQFLQQVHAARLQASDCQRSVAVRKSALGHAQTFVQTDVFQFVALEQPTRPWLSLGAPHTQHGGLAAIGASDQPPKRESRRNIPVMYMCGGHTSRSAAKIPPPFSPQKDVQVLMSCTICCSAF